jgi:hypothetical protein
VLFVATIFSAGVNMRPTADDFVTGALAAFLPEHATWQADRFQS